MLALGDALAMTLLVEKGFKAEDFANLHPGGTLGKSLMRVESLMHAGADCPTVQTTTGMQDVLAEISSKRLGMACVVDADGLLMGVITVITLAATWAGRARLPHRAPATGGASENRSMGDLLKLPALRAALITNAIVMIGWEIGRAHV